MPAPRTPADSDLARPRTTAPDAETVVLTAEVLAPLRPVGTAESAAVAPPVSWPWAAVGGGLLTAVASWVLWAGVTVLGWLAADAQTLRDALVTGTDLWLLGNGVSVRFGTIAVTVVPWGAVALTVFMLSRSARLAARLTREDQPIGAVAVGLVVLASYAAPVLATTVFFGEPWQAPLHCAAVAVVLASAAVWGAGRGLGQDLTADWPGWLRYLPRAVFAGQLVLLTAGAALLTVSLIQQLDRVTALTQALDPGALGGTALLLGQLAFAPNLCVWSASYALGAGFSLGSGTIVAPAGTTLGVLPGIPVLGALPDAGPGSTGVLWWLAAGVLAGAVAAALVVRGRRGARFDETSLLGGLAGALGGLVFAGVAWAAGGDLGELRLAGLGPRLQPLLVMAVSTLGLAGLITGALLGLARRGRRAESELPEAAEPKTAEVFPELP